MSESQTRQITNQKKIPFVGDMRHSMYNLGVEMDLNMTFHYLNKIQDAQLERYIFITVQMILVTNTILVCVAETFNNFSSFCDDAGCNR